MQSRIEIAAIDAVMVTFDARIELSINQAVHQLREQLILARPPWLRDVVAGYHSLMVVYDISQVAMATVVQVLEQNLATQLTQKEPSQTQQQHVFHVCYDAEYAPDIERVAALTGHSVEDVINLHSERIYHVYTVGFAPGFAYLGDVNERLQVPRLATPRQQVPAGSVAIANQQTAIYPRSSPGGWNIIGRVANWRVQRGLDIVAGDQVRFIAITQDQFAELQAVDHD